jgi:two-component system phosphate regulon sensor histidine kinase PhoR
VALSGLCVLAVSLYFLLVYDSQASTGTTLLHLALIALSMGSIAVGLALLIGSQIAGPINQLIDTLRQAAPGTSTPKIAAMRDDETGELIHSFNTMTDKFRKEYMQLAGERDRSSLILERMGDGIVVVDGQCRITAVNPAWLRIFNLDEVNAIGLSFIEAVRDYELEQPVRRCLKTRKLQQEYLDLKEKKLYLGLVVTPLAGESGCLVLVQDLSRLKKLEAIRRDFIANISHELRTPLSSIKLLAETLKDGSLDDGRVSADLWGALPARRKNWPGSWKE